MRNRSVPADIILPHLVYQDVAAAIDWLTRVFGFTEHFRYGDPAQGAQMHFGDAWIMLSVARPGRSSPAQAGVWTQMLSVFVDDVDGHFEKVKSAGAKIVEDLNETMYGERQFVAEDIEGHPWLFARHARDVSPEEWGAVVAAEKSAG
jgi:uncharacterized glyoxalase superfamily protein PhnB